MQAKQCDVNVEFEKETLVYWMINIHQNDAASPILQP